MIGRVGRGAQPGEVVECAGVDVAGLQQQDTARIEFGYLRRIDAALLIDSAVKAVGGDLSDKDAVRAALEAAEFESLRGKFKFNNNHFPVQDFYLLRVAQRDDGKYWTEVEKKVFEDYTDSFAEECKM